MTNVFHLNIIVFLHYLVKLEMLISHVLPLRCYRNNSRIYPTSTVIPKFARFESRVWETIAREGVQNMHH